MEIEYIGEHLLPGTLGHFFTALSFVCTLVATLSFYFASREKNHPTWLQIGKQAFRIHSLSVVGIIGILFYILTNHYYEYNYVWQHSNNEMPFRYILACFWEGQEGSLLLWAFWNLILGNIFMQKSRQFLAPNMAVISMAQVFLSSMILGVYFLGYKFGSSPFILLRENPEMANLPFTGIADYANKIDGKGLNPILQNYWMIIHPPTLFLGFASTLIPFAYAISGFWKGKYNEWQRHALPWTYFAVMILGLGILMGGIWAYEALSFGGFWAWDPVENASLVPWLTLVGAAHILHLSKVKSPPIKLSYFLVSITFIYVLYSTFLTRSGILGDTSVHAFTDLGISGQLLLYLFFFIGLALFFLFKNWNKIPGQDSEESVYSREFWMMIGALVLFVSSFQILFSTSIPVINTIFGTELAPPVDPIAHYNSWQIPFAVIIAILIGFCQFLNYKKTKKKDFLKKISVSLLLGTVITIVIGWSINMTNYFHLLLLFASIFAVTANIQYLSHILNGKILKGGASIAHIGFGLILLGALISTSKSDIISQNSSGVDIQGIGKNFSNQENILLNLNDTLTMGDYKVSYRGSEKIGINIYYNIDFLSETDKGLEKEFTLKPIVQLNKVMGNVAEPDTRHFIDKDIYTHITFADLEKAQGFSQNTDLTTTDHLMKIGDSIFSSNSIITLEKIIPNIPVPKYKLKEGDIAVGAELKTISMLGKETNVHPTYLIIDQQVFSIPDTIQETGTVFIFNKIDPSTGEITIKMIQNKKKKKDFVILKAIVFPFINVLWSGIILMVLGTIIAIRNRIVIMRDH